MKKINNEELLRMHSLGMIDSEIAIQLQCTRSAVTQRRHKLKLLSNKKNIHNKISKQQKEVLIGCVLGDGSILINSGKKQPIFQCSHGPKQFEYNLWKYNLLNSLKPKIKEYIRKTPNKKTGKIYKFNLLRTEANLELIELRSIFYVNNKKIITDKLLENYSDLSLAIHYMDDGYIIGKTYGFATCGFNRESVETFKNFLLRKFNIESTISKDNRIRIRNKSTGIIDKIIRPYIIKINCMKYKLIK